MKCKYCGIEVSKDEFGYNYLDYKGNNSYHGGCNLRNVNKSSLLGTMEKQWKEKLI